MSHDARTWLTRPFGEGAFLSVAALLGFVTYLLVFSLTGDNTLLEDALSSLRNLATLALVVLAIRPVLVRYALAASGMVQLAWHLLLGAVFALTWYWLLMIVLGLANGEGLTRFQVRPVFDDPAFTWQLLQGATVYTAVASLTLLRLQRRRTSPEPSAEPRNVQELGDRSTLDRYLVRKGDEFLPEEVGDIVCIEGADDYAEVVTLTGRHLLRTTLKDLEQSLDADSFVRVHRSRIVNIRRLLRAEPAGGGRLILHMANGASVQTSRAGARLIRELTL